LPLAVQSKLLRVLQSGEIQPVGKDNVEQVNVRVIAATNRNLEEEVSEGRFRADLYHRLSVYPIKVPPLKDRDQDVLLLAGYFLEKTSRKLGIRQLRLAQDAELALRSYHWPGNVRELEHVISRASLKAKAKPTTTGIISLNSAFLELPATTTAENSVAKMAEIKPMLSLDMDLKTATNEFQKHCILTAVTHADGNWSEAARSLKIDRANLVRMAKRLGVSIKKSVVNH